MISPECGRWFKSTHSANTSTCVEVVFVEGADGIEAHVRNSQSPDGPSLTFTRGEWEAFELGVFAGEFHMPF